MPQQRPNVIEIAGSQADVVRCSKGCGAELPIPRPGDPFPVCCGDVMVYALHGVGTRATPVSHDRRER